MGMADARDRTVATNYLQQTIEDFKNMDFAQVKGEPITPIPNTKFSRGTYVLNLEEIDGVVTLKKVISQVRWVDRKGNIKTEKASTILYKKPATSAVGTTALELILYAQSYYTILPTSDVILVAEIRDENGNIYDCNDPITFSIITVRDVDGNPQPVGSIKTEQPVNAASGVSYCTFEAISGVIIEGTERIQATATVDENNLSDTVNIRVTTGPVGILLEPVEEEDRVKEAGVGVVSNIKMTVVKADYETPIHYDGLITLDAKGPGTLSDNSFSIVETDGQTFTITSDNTPGIVEITASSMDLDIGYIEITFTGEPDSILVEAEKNSVYPSEDIKVKVTIVDVNNIPVEYNGNVSLTALPPYGTFNADSLSFTGQSSLYTTVFTVDSDATPGDTITIHANYGGDLSGSTEITILSSLTPTYLDIFAYPFSVDLNDAEVDKSITVTAEVYDQSGHEKVTTYNTPITFYSKRKIGGEDFGTFDYISMLPTGGEAEVILSSLSPGTSIITASSGDLKLRPAEGREVTFYQSANHIELSADPLSIEADGNQTSIITARIYDFGENTVKNYGDDNDYPKIITLTAGKGGFPDNSNLATISTSSFDEGLFKTEFSSSSVGSAVISVDPDHTSDSLDDNGDVSIECTGNISSEVSDPFNIALWGDYITYFDIKVTVSHYT